MPELPEVETTRAGIAPHVEGHRLTAVAVRQPRLRWPVPVAELEGCVGARCLRVERRAKYLLLCLDNGQTLILHLGMSGSLRLVAGGDAPGKHDHIDLVLDDGQALRLHDPRRFGALLHTATDPQQHPLIAELGPEPLSAAFDGDTLWHAAQGRKMAVKPFIMDGKRVVGVGNIYANEALFRARIDPRRPAGRIARERYQRLAEAIKAVLAEAIAQGGTTLRDFVGGDGKPGYFAQQLAVYGKEGAPCPACTRPLQQVTLGQRSSFFCPHCQH